MNLQGNFVPLGFYLPPRNLKADPKGKGKIYSQSLAVTASVQESCVSACNYSTCSCNTYASRKTAAQLGPMPPRGEQLQGELAIS